MPTPADVGTVPKDALLTPLHAVLAPSKRTGGGNNVTSVGEQKSESLPGCSSATLAMSPVKAPSAEPPASGVVSAILDDTTEHAARAAAPRAASFTVKARVQKISPEVIGEEDVERRMGWIS